jgi:dihydroorotase/N-acyl-D-amino-acid deacylase
VGWSSLPLAHNSLLYLLVWAICATQCVAAGPPLFDLVIIHGHIIDGTGSPWYASDLGIRDGKIAAIGQLTRASSGQRIDAENKVVAPGFIDMLGQSDLSILVEPSLPSKIFQGITTEITGEGGSVAPINERLIEADHDSYTHYHVKPDWRTLRQYFDRLEKQRLGINFATYVGATQVRRIVLGEENVQPTPSQIDRMKHLVAEAMRDGAVGVSSSLMYAPAPYAQTEELIALAAEAAQFGGIYATHIRNESGGVLAALDEAILIGREAKIPVEIWHLKVAGKRNWGRMPEVIAKISEAGQ